MYEEEYLFGSAGGTEGLAVTGDMHYDGNCGFVTEEDRREKEELSILELNTGFDTVYWFRQENLTAVGTGKSCCYVKEKRQLPLCFKAAVPKQGNYKVTVAIQPEEDMEDVLLFTGRRRLAYKAGRIEAGGQCRITAMVNVCDIIPRGKTEVYEDRTVDIAIMADRACISGLRVEEAVCPTIYIAGDSTVTDQSADYPYAPGSSYSGWGQMLTAFLDTGISVSNHSHSGLTTESFRGEGHYGIMEKYIQPGDYVLFQFGHNDQKLDSLKAGEGYRDNLVRYIRECREKGAYPLLVTPLARNSWKGNDGSYNDLLCEYAGVCLALGEELDVPVLDLHGKSMEFIKELGVEEAKRYFFPNDYTHSNDYGAYRMAAFVAGEILRTCKGHKEAAYRELAGHVGEGFGDWEPPRQVVLPVKPEGYGDAVNPEAAAELFADMEDADGMLGRAEALNMVIQTAHFFPTNVYNDMFDDIVGHEWYAGAVECAWQNGMIPPEMCSGRYFYPEREVKMKEFLAFAMNGYRSRKKLPEETPCSYDGQTEDYLRPYVRAACALGLIGADGSEDMEAGISRGRAAQICRSLHI